MSIPKPIQNGHILTQDAAINIYSITRPATHDYIIVVDKSVKQKAAKLLDAAYTQWEQILSKIEDQAIPEEKRCASYLAYALQDKGIDHEIYIRYRENQDA